MVDGEFVGDQVSNGREHNYGFYDVSLLIILKGYLLRLVRLVKR